MTPKETATELRIKCAQTLSDLDVSIHCTQREIQYFAAKCAIVCLNDFIGCLDDLIENQKEYVGNLLGTHKYYLEVEKELENFTKQK